MKLFCGTNSSYFLKIFHIVGVNGSALSISTEAIARAAQFPTVQSMNDIEVVQNIQQLFLEPELAIDSEAMRARGIIVLVKSN